MVIEATWSKRRILEMYVNIVQFGDCTFGVEAASRRFFAKPAARLTQAEAALLAASLPNPVRFRVDRPGELMRKRTIWIVVVSKRRSVDNRVADVRRVPAGADDR